MTQPPHTRRMTRQQLLLSFMATYPWHCSTLRQDLEAVFGGTAELPFNQFLDRVIRSATHGWLRNEIFTLVDVRVMLADELIASGLPPLEDDQGPFKDLRRMRNKLFGHRYEAQGGSVNHEQWSRQQYADPLKVADLIAEGAEVLVNEIEAWALVVKPSIGPKHFRPPHPVSRRDVEEVVQAMQAWRAAHGPMGRGG